MRKKKQDRLEAAGWKVGSLTDFLGLSAEEAAMEAADSSVSIDLLVRTLVASGTSGATIGRAFADIDARRKVRRSA